MPDLSAMNVSKNSSMNEIIQTSLADPSTQASIWGSSAFGKSLSSSSIIQDQSIRGSSNFGKPNNGNYESIFVLIVFSRIFYNGQSD